MNSRFSTLDIILAAYLKASNYKLIDLVRQGNRGTFIFEDVPVKAITDYDLGFALIEPKALSAQIRALTTAARR
jgi:hypothetical protein